jgi:hypothetical protein
VEATADAGIECRSFLLAEGRSPGAPLAQLARGQTSLGSEPPRRSYPSFEGCSTPTIGDTILFEWQGFAVLTDSGMRRLLRSLVHTADAPR